MTRTDLRTYTPGFRGEAVKLVLEQGLSLEEAAQRLSTPKDQKQRPAFLQVFAFLESMKTQRQSKTDTVLFGIGN